MYTIHVVFFSWFKVLFINHQIQKLIVCAAGMRSKIGWVYRSFWTAVWNAMVNKTVEIILLDSRISFSSRVLFSGRKFFLLSRETFARVEIFFLELRIFFFRFENFLLELRFFGSWTFYSIRKVSVTKFWLSYHVLIFPVSSNMTAAVLLVVSYAFVLFQRVILKTWRASCCRCCIEENNSPGKDRSWKYLNDRLESHNQIVAAFLLLIFNIHCFLEIKALWESLLQNLRWLLCNIRERSILNVDQKCSLNPWRWKGQWCLNPTYINDRC